MSIKYPPQRQKVMILVDMDVVFPLAHLEGVSPVTVSLRKDIPAAGSPEADRILGFRNDTDNDKE